ncbi:3-hydroxy-3-methylglutaryl-CoA reductase 2, partial [Aureobasidium melanogenum]
VDFSALSQGSRTLSVGPETAWEWQSDLVSNHAQTEHLSLVTLAFADSYAHAPSVVIPNDSKAELLPSSNSRLSLSQDSTLAFSLPSDETPAFLASIKEISAQESAEDDDEQKRWITRAARGSARRFSLREWVRNSWIAFTDLIRNAETLDIIIMALGYLSMHLTFASLFVSMRRMGSNAWLATSVLFSSAFALLFGLVVTMKLGVPVNVVLLSEGLPFLVVTVGFEKPIILTQAVLSAALNPPRRENGDQAPLTIQNAVQTAVHERGWGIVRDYIVEITLLIAGAMSGIQGGLRQFCFLAAWVLFFDCILLFTFYTAVLTIKLEVN